MNKYNITKVQGLNISYHQLDGVEYINITDIAKRKDENRPERPIQRWMRSQKTIEFLYIWEKKNNPEFKHSQTGVFSGYEVFAGEMLRGKHPSVSKWITYTSAKGLRVIRGRHGGTFAHRDIAFHFANWLDVEFYLYIIEEFQRLKTEKLLHAGDPLGMKRFLTAGNHSLLVASLLTQIDERLLTGEQPYKRRLPFASEIDMINEIVFGTTAKNWRLHNPDKPPARNMRDYGSVLELVLYQNLEVIDAMLILWDCEKEERKKLLQHAYDFMYPVFKNSKTVKRMQELHDKKIKNLE